MKQKASSHYPNAIKSGKSYCIKARIWKTWLILLNWLKWIQLTAFFLPMINVLEHSPDNSGHSSIIFWLFKNNSLTFVATSFSSFLRHNQVVLSLSSLSKSSTSSYSLTLFDLNLASSKRWLKKRSKSWNGFNFEQNQQRVEFKAGCVYSWKHPIVHIWRTPASLDSMDVFLNPFKFN